MSTAEARQRGGLPASHVDAPRTGNCAHGTFFDLPFSASCISFFSLTMRATFLSLGWAPVASSILGALPGSCRELGLQGRRLMRNQLQAAAQHAGRPERAGQPISRLQGAFLLWHSLQLSEGRQAQAPDSFVTSVARASHSHSAKLHPAGHSGMARMKPGMAAQLSSLVLWLA